VDSRAASPVSSSLVHRPTRFIARQPIFDRSEQVYGYELLFRSVLENRCTAEDADAAALDVADNFLNASARTLSAGRRALINGTRRVLVNEYATLRLRCPRWCGPRSWERTTATRRFSNWSRPSKRRGGTRSANSLKKSARGAGGSL